MKAGGRAVLAIGCVLAMAGVVSAWVPLAGALRPDGRVPITVALTETAPSGSTGDFFGAAVEAMTLWNAKLQRLQLTPVPLEGEAWYENGRNEVFFDVKMFDRAWPSGLLAVTATTEDRDVVVETDIIFNAGRRWSVYRGALRETEDLRRVMVHELGHLLGLGHPDDAGQKVPAIMNSLVSDVEGPTSDDEFGVRALYDFGPGAAPVILDDRLEPADVKQGAGVRLAVLAAGRGPLVYEWRRDGMPIAGATLSTLQFTAGLGDGGDYAVVVRNGGGSITSKAARVVVRPAVAPVVVSGSLDRSVEAGADTVFGGGLSRGDAPLRYEWRKNGVLIPGATDLQLGLSDVQFSDAGDYALTAINIAGRATTPVMRLAVTPAAPPCFQGELPSSVVEPGGRILLVAPADTSSAVTYQWRKDGVDLPGATEARLSIGAFLPADAGRYTVTMGNAIGSVTSRAAELTGFERAELSILRQPVAVTQYPGASVSFEVESDAAGPSYQWFKDGVARAGARTHLLALANIGPNDSGVYSVEVSDGIRRVRSEGARLTVMTPGELIIRRHPATHTVTAGSPVELSVDARVVVASGGVSSVNEPLVYQWSRDGQPLAGQTTATLALVATAGNAGGYRVLVTASVGVVESDKADVVIVPTAGFFAAHPASAAYEAGSEELRLSGVAADVARRRALRENQSAVHFYSREGQVLPGTPFERGDGLPGTYTLTVGLGDKTETSRPFTLGLYTRGGPVISRHPQGGAFSIGEPVILRVTSDLRESTGPGDGVFYEWYRDGTRLPGGTINEYRIAAFSAADRGDYVFVATNRAGSARSEPARLEIRSLPTPIIRTHPTGAKAAAGQQVTLSVVVWRSGYRYQWLKSGRPIDGGTSDRWSLVVSAETAGDYAVNVTDGVRTATSRTAMVELEPTVRAPEILKAPGNATVSLGGEVALSVGADGAPLPDRYQWKKNGVDIPGATDAKLKLRDVTGDAAGAYSVVVTNSVGSVTSRAATLTVDARGRLVNLATRAAVGRDGDILIAGFVIGGTESRQVLVRGIGDQLSEFGVSGVLRDPVVSLYDATGKLVDSNDDWFRLSEAQRTALEAAAKQVGAFAQREDARDGALLATLAPGSYTVKVAGLANTTGVGLVEVYELGKPGTGRLVNLSSRAVVGTGGNILIPGLVLNGQTPRRLLIRAVGPGLAEFGVAGTLGDPVMTVFRGSEEVARNDNWGEQAGAAGAGGAASVASIRTTMAAVGAFGLKDGSRDAVLLLDLPPGSYTVQVAGVAGATGVALVEVYEVGL